MSRVANIISFEQNVPASALKLAESVGMKVTTFDEVMAQGKKNASWKMANIVPDDTCMFSYTSGTTGDPKGVKLHHLMVITAVAASNYRNGTKPFDESDCYISYLPAAHSFEQCMFSMSLVSGMKCGYFSGDIMKMISHDIPSLKPTFFPSVPRLYNRIYGKI